MLGRIFSTFGSFFGNFLGGGVISTVMRFAGKSLGNYLERSSYDPDEYYHHKYHLENLYISTNTNGKTIPLVFGKARVAGQMIWATPIEEVALSSTDYRYFNDSDDVRSINHNTEYLYYANFALAICEGVVSEINRIWIGGIESDLSEYKFRIYYGTEDQMQDPLIESVMGVGSTPAHRGLCYIVFEKLPLIEFSNNIPSFSFEVTRKPDVDYGYSLEEQITNMVMIPGSGEFVYDTMCQDKIIYSDQDHVELYREPINYHNSQNIANSIYSLNALQMTCKNLEWVAPVVTWFADNIDAGIANIFPAVEHNDPSFSATEEWSVAGMYRDNVRVISRDKDNSPNYGGTINDASLVRYLDEIRSRGLKVMLYPMIFLDVPGKPWRGYMTSTPDGIRKFFNHPEGYKRFILHYAHLAKGRVDAFIIGSEMQDLTGVQDNNCFPAVLELIEVARQVKVILGDGVKVTYAANWSEYHHTDGGWYNLDELWSSDAIDAIGIDAYFPITDSKVSDIDFESIKQGWKSGEGYDYYVDNGTGDKIPLSPEWAFKNIEYWWKNYHINPNGMRTNWKPKSKKIWFTEFGFPSIDKATNQPNIFYDPECVNGGVPKNSTGEVDFGIQRIALKATLEFWKNSEFVEEMFVWTWDARPYPAWPHGQIWKDGSKWLYGHWLNGKLGVSSVGNILLELCKRAGIDRRKINIDTIDEMVSGLAITKQSSIWDVMNLLRLVYFFDIRCNYLDMIEFKKRSIYQSLYLESTSLVRTNKDSIVEIINVSEENILSEISMTFPDESNAYCYNNIHVVVERVGHKAIYYLNLPMVMDESGARNVANRIIDSSFSENKIFKFSVTMEYIFKISPGDLVMLIVYNTQYKIRIIEVKISKLYCEVFGVCESKEVLYQSYQKSICAVYQNLLEKRFELFELPVSLSSRHSAVIYAAVSQKCSLYSVLNDLIKIADMRGSNIAKVNSVINNLYANDMVIDAVSKFTIFSYQEVNAPTQLDILNGKNSALIGDELIYFREVEKISNNLYIISQLVRGCGFTKITQHLVGERFIILNGVIEISISEAISPRLLTFEAMSIQKTIMYNKLSKKSATVINVKTEKRDHFVFFKWDGRVKNMDPWSNSNIDMIYTLQVQLLNGIKEFKTKDENFSINFLQEGISVDAKVSIIATQRGFSDSDKYCVN